MCLIMPRLDVFQCNFFSVFNSLHSSQFRIFNVVQRYLFEICYCAAAGFLFCFILISGAGGCCYSCYKAFNCLRSKTFCFRISLDSNALNFIIIKFSFYSVRDIQNIKSNSNNNRELSVVYG